MKKLITLATVLVLLASLAVPASASEDAYALYRTYLRKMDWTTSMGMKGTIELGMTLGDLSVSSKSVFDAQLVNQEDGTTHMRLEQNTDGRQQLIWGKDNYLYAVNNAGKKVKMENPSNQLLSYLPSDWAITRADFEDAVVTPLDDGGARLRFTVDGEPSAEVASMMYEELGLDATVTFADGITYTLTLDSEGYLKAFRYSTVGTMEYEGVTLSVEYKADVKVYSVNRLKQIGFPNDLNLYVKASSLD